MGPVAHHTTSPDPKVFVTPATPDLDTEAVADRVGLASLDRLSATLAPICVALSAHLASHSSDVERAALEPLALVAGDALVAVRLARLGAHARIARSCGDGGQGGRDRNDSVSLDESAMARLHSVQWTALEACHEFMAEWEDVEVISAPDADRLRRDTEVLISRISGNPVTIESGGST